MNAIFLRIYGGMLGVLILVALLGVLTLHIANQVRGERYREQLAQGTFTLMADNLRAMDSIERTRALAVWERLLGIPLALQTVAQAHLEGGARHRLSRGQVVVEQTGPHAARIFREVEPGTPGKAESAVLLSGDVQQISEQLARATIFLLLDELVRFPLDEQPTRLEALRQNKDFGFDMHLIQLEQADVDDDQRRRIDEGDTVMALGKGGDSIRVLSGVGKTPWVLEIGPLYQFNPYPPQLLVLITLLGLGLIGVVVYLLVRRLEHRLRGLEAAATQIAQGSLHTRVPATGADSVGRLAMAFNGMAEHLQRSLTIQRELVRAVSHELRTPVARLRFGLEMVNDASTPQARHKYLVGMDNDIQDLDKLVDEMLTYARLEQGSPTLDFRRIDLDALIDQVIAELAPLRADVRVIRGQRSVTDEEASTAGQAWVEAAPRYLHRALQNLLSNALRHAESEVRIGFHLGEGRCRIDIEDDGPGVPEGAWERIFTPFMRLDDSRTRASGGHGLGLSIVRRIVHWHRGRALIGRSERLGGACFSLTWPRQQGRP
ncbi:MULTISPECIES: ATP-binding protein [unclassified Pseudomonas]|uniref:ATP-binding protein n=1 Tax=unclassified Pseudomonas TaxID=196821 RepID=UPI000D356955|nr:MULTISPECIES: ATP-binding protein [unclassified Pseudomonas]RAU49376.1 HAMP domain-containing protein [Pseudomonas sp. RIT 409]RAU55884.1 HAMP domain-containing protein [Pseudomonas sp. RIT 412]